MYIILLCIGTRRPVIERFYFFFAFGIFIIIFNLFFHSSPSYVDRIAYGYFVFIRILDLSMVVLLWTSLISPSDIIQALRFLPPSIQLLLTMTYYFIPSIIDEAENIRIIQKARGLHEGVLYIFPQIIPLFHRVFHRAQILSLTIVARGFEEKT